MTEEVAPGGRADVAVERTGESRAVEPTKPVTMRYLPGIDGLRAVAVVAVLFYHGDVASLPGGFLGVEVFFVVSGYLITSLLLSERRSKGGIDLRQFWGRRARRLLPALFALLGVVVAYSLLFLPDAIETLKGDVVAALAYVSNWWQIFGEQSYFVESGRPPLLQHLWSLAVEEQFYLLWPLALGFVLARWPRRKVMVGILVAALASSLLMAVLVQPYHDATRVYYGTDTRLSGLLLGALLAFVWAPYKFRGRPGRGAGFVVDSFGLLGVVVVAWSFTRVNDFDPFVYRGGFLVLSLATVLVIAAVVHPSAKLGAVFGIAPLVWIGVRSYGIYLWHWPVYAVTRPGTDIALHGRPLLVLRLGITVLLAELSFRYVEQPIRRGAIGDYMSSLRAVRGRHRRTLAGRGALVGASALAGAVLLGLGLANATGQPVNASGRTAELAAAQADDDPSAPVAAATLTTAAEPNTGGGAGREPSAGPKSADRAADQDGSKASDADDTGRKSTPTTVAEKSGPGGKQPSDKSSKTSETTGKGDGEADGTTKAGKNAADAESKDTAPVADTEATEKQTSPETAPPAPAGGPRILAVGDSVMLGASEELGATMPGILVDAKVSRAFPNAIDVIAWYRDNGLLRDVVVVHQGTNGAFSDEQFDQMMAIIGGERTAIFVNANVPRSWEGAVNDRLAAGTARFANAHLIDWKAFSAGHGDWFASDGFHLDAAGAQAYATLIADTVAATTS